MDQKNVFYFIKDKYVRAAQVLPQLTNEDEEFLTRICDKEPEIV